MDGACDPRFDRVRDALRDCFEVDGERGASVCAIASGRTVVDLWDGHTDEAESRPWQRDTLVNAYSVGKGVLAMLALHCVAAGELDLDATVASIWPEFGAHGKDRLTVRALLAHRAGLPAVRTRLPEAAMYDFEGMSGALAAQAPYWEPDSAHGYHVGTQGYLVGSVLERVTGVPVGRLLRERLAGPLGADFWFGLPASEHARVSWAFVPNAKLTTPEQWAMAFPPTGDEVHDFMIWHCYFNPSGLSGTTEVNTGAWREAVIPSTNGHANARATAQLYAAWLSGKMGVGAELRGQAATIHSDGDDRVLGKPSRFGLGFQLAQPTRPLGPNPLSYGHYGYGGSLGMADPDAELAFAYVTNSPGVRWQTPRTQRLLEALYACL